MENVYVEYIICFATQHRHFADLNMIEEYVHKVLNDEILPMEFYELNSRRFGGEIRKEDYENLSLTWLSQKWGHSLEYLSPMTYEIASWSGKYDSGKKNLADLK